ncbi:ESF2/ABP1 family protein [Entomortierella parvispora]|uniref:18S rRNA factor 2 n=1 Tax=Entomortierella parvispora TaxID=205924 RepID=A0A9P3H9H3_9FUNG|nr:ESF2/ABP1 family protein [Entomortierella parvispora]
MTSKTAKSEDLFNLPGGDDDGSASDNGSGYDSDDKQAAHMRKASKKSGAKSKKAKANTVVFGLDQGDNDSDEDDDDYSSQEEDNEEADDTMTTSQSSDPRFQLGDTKSEADGEKKTRVRTKKTKRVQPLTPEALEKFQAARDKAGIVYLSKIPPFMKPVKLRHLLGKFGELGRVYLAPEDPKVAARRKKYGGNKKQNFTEGWVEFVDKAVAKNVAKSLNTTIIGGNKSSYYHDDMWNIKYLPKFKWNHLTERIAYENASRAQRLQAEISQAKRENKFIMNNIEKSKMIKNMEEKKAAKRKAEEGEGSSTANTASTAAGGETKGVRRAFKQRRLGGDNDGDQKSRASEAPKSGPVQGKIKSVLGSVFGR